MSHKLITAVLPLILLSGPNPAFADSLAYSIGMEPRRWLELQSSGVEASKNRQMLSGPVADEIYKRYLKSFEHPIPEFYKTYQGGGGSGGMSGGGGAPSR